MSFERIIKFDPWLLGAIQKAMGNLPVIPGDLVKVKSLTFFDGSRVLGDEGTLLNGWMELASGEFSAIGKMTNLHTLLFKNHSIMPVGNYDFLKQCRKLKKLDLSGTDFSDCALLAELPNLQYAMLPDRRQLVHTEVLERIPAWAETEPEKDERSRAEACIDIAAKESARAGESMKACNGAAVEGKPGMPSRMAIDTYTADSRLICWIMASLGKMPRTPDDLAKVKILDSRKRNPSLYNGSLGNLAEKLPPWLIEKEGDFSLIGKLPNLQALFLWGVILDDFSFLSECRELLYLNLWDTNFTDCSLLVKLPYIKHIYLPEEGQLVNFSMLIEYKDFRLQEEQQRREGFLYEAKYDETSEAGQAQTVHVLGRPSVFRIECQRAFGKKASFTKCNERQALPEVVRENDASAKTEGNEAFYQEDEFDDLITVRGEDVVILYEGASQVRHVEAEFWMDQVPVLWKIFDQVREEEDNWVKLAPLKAEQLTDELMDAIRREDVKTLYISLEPWGEDHSFIVEFAGGWAEITYMDDETPVYYNSYNPAYTNPAELSPIEFEGQTPIPKMLALEDMELAEKIVRHILATGQLLPGTLWKTGGVS